MGYLNTIQLLSIEKAFVMKHISYTELPLNNDNSVYHLNLLPEDIAETIILVGDKERVALVSSFFENIDLGIGIRFFNSKIVPIPDVEVINENIQYSSHVVNIVMEENQRNESNIGYAITEATRTYYKYFQDDRDFLDFATTSPTPGVPGAASFDRVSINIIGLEECYDNNCITLKRD